MFKTKDKSNWSNGEPMVDVAQELGEHLKTKQNIYFLFVLYLYSLSVCRFVII